VARTRDELLAWFHQRVGQWTYFPEPLDDGSILVTSAKGIYKPAGSDCALSVRNMLSSPFKDGKVRVRDDGSWYDKYHQEGSGAEDLQTL